MVHQVYSIYLRVDNYCCIGFAICLLQAFQYFHNAEFLKVAIQAEQTCSAQMHQSNVMEEFKGLGLCHGLPGLVLISLQLYSITKQDKYYKHALYGCEKLLHWKWNIQNKQWRMPDHLWSVWEGVGGAVWAIASLLWNPTSTKGFPCVNDV